jgi:hypothetical protein
MTGATIETRTVAVGVSLAILLAAFVVFLQAGEYQSLGPLDLETADRLALALWVAAPVAGGLAGRRLSNEELARAALALGLTVGLVVAIFGLFAAGTGDYTCAINLPSFQGGYALGCLAFGAVAGLGMAIGFLVSGTAARRSVMGLPGVVLAGAATLATSAAAYELFYGAVRCLR